MWFDAFVKQASYWVFNNDIVIYKCNPIEVFAACIRYRLSVQNRNTSIIHCLFEMFYSRNCWKFLDIDEMQDYI